MYWMYSAFKSLLRVHLCAVAEDSAGASRLAHRWRR